MKSDIPLVSVAIITYNQKEFLVECIESVLAQDYDNLEIVIADDGSTDGTQEILKEYEKKYPGKFILRLAEKNEGITKNSNRAYFSCSGKYIAWMGGDDLMSPGKIRKQVEFMEANPDCSICYHNLEVFDSNTKKTLYFFNDKKFNTHEGDITVSIKYGTFNGACSTMTRADKTPKEGYNETLPVASDWLFWIETLANGGKICYIDEVLGKYRRHNKNVTASSSALSQNEIDHLNTCNILLKKYPQYFNEIMFAYSRLFYTLRYKLNYSKALLISLGFRFSVKVFIKLILYFLTIGRVKK